jgi:hypothetical protein
MDHALPDSLKSDLGLSKTGTAQSTSAWNEEPHFLHLPTVPEIVPGAVNLDQTNLCCYCFTRRADHLIIDCREFLSSPIQVVDFCAYLFADLQNFAVIVFLMQCVEGSPTKKCCIKTPWKLGQSCSDGGSSWWHVFVLRLDITMFEIVPSFASFLSRTRVVKYVA